MLALRLVTWNYSSTLILTFSAKSGRSSSSPWSSRRPGFISLGVKGGPRYGIDFRGGALITVSFANRPPVDKVRAALSGKLPVEVQEVSGQPEDIIGIDALQDAALQASRQKVIDSLDAAFGQPANGKYNINSGGAAALADHLRDGLGGGERAAVGPAAPNAGGQHHGLSEAAFRAGEESR